MKKINIFKSFLFSFTFILLFVFGIFTYKVEALTISPARMELSGDPGTTITKDITLLNDTQSDATYYVSYANFEAQGETGSPLFVEPKSDLGTWMNTDKSVTLSPGESKIISLNIDIPTDAYAGGHFSVVFFGNNSDNGGQVSVGAKTGTLILLSVNGDVLEAGGLVDFGTYGLSKEDKIIKKSFFTSLPVTFQYRWKNDGNDRVKPEGKIIIRSLFFIPVAHIDANKVSGNILPHSTRLFDIDWVKFTGEKEKMESNSFLGNYFDQVLYQWKNFAVGPYLAHLDLEYGLDKVHSTKNVIFFVFPWQLLICIIIALIVILFISKKLLKRYNAHIIEKARLGMITPGDASHG